MNRITNKFQELKKINKCAFVAYICAGDPDYSTSLSCLKALPKNGVDIIEIGVPFLDPAGDGPTIETAAKRSIASGMDLKKTLKMVAEFRQIDNSTPIILMSYYNPILKFGINKIFVEAKKVGVDGFLIVDLPPEEEHEIINDINQNKLDLIRLIAPNTPTERIKKIVKNSSGFIYLISMLGITGTKFAKVEENKNNFNNLRNITNLPIVIGFGIQDDNQAKQFAQLGFDGVVVGSAIVKEISDNFTSSDLITKFEKKVAQFSNAIK